MPLIPNEPAVQVGRYLVSPLVKRLADGDFAASVSLRCGAGTTTTDRVLRFHHRFHSREAALRHAVRQGEAWARDPVRWHRA